MGRAEIAYGDLNSSLAMESYREFQAGVQFGWTPGTHWRLAAEAMGRRTRYHRVPAFITCVRETNDVWSAGLEVSRFQGKWEFFGALGRTWGEVPLSATPGDLESYTQTVLQCGLSYTF
jgi:hypothetical protein